MSPVIVRKTLREARLLVVVAVVGLIIFELFLIAAIGEAAGEIQRVLRSLAFVRRIVSLLAGADLLADPTATAFASFALAHPLVYAVTWAVLLTTASRGIAGEIERGTADLLLTLPVSRLRVYAGLSAALVLMALLLAAVTWAGVGIATRLNPLWEPVDVMALVPVAGNFAALLLAVAMLALCVSALSSRQGITIGIVLAVLLVSVLINFLEQFWKPAQHVAFLGLLHYYRPVAIVRSEGWPWSSIGVLLAVAAAAWTAGLIRFLRRDIPAA